jgi:hypothetical protein
MASKRILSGLMSLIGVAVKKRDERSKDIEFFLPVNNSLPVKVLKTRRQLRDPEAHNVLWQGALAF